MTIQSLFSDRFYCCSQSEIDRKSLRMLKLEVGRIVKGIPARGAHKVLPYGDTLFISSGLATPSKPDVSTWQFNVKLQLFREVKPAPPMSGRAICTLAEWNGVIYSILGFEKKSVGTFNVKSEVWDEIIFDNCPNQIYAHAGVQFGHEVYCHGGLWFEGFDHNPNIYVYNLKTHVVRCIEPFDGNRPSTRICHTFEKWNNKGYTFGGVGGQMVHYNMY
jgi:hypothetical protein